MITTSLTNVSDRPKPAVMPQAVASSTIRNHTPPPEDVPRSITPEPEELEGTTVTSSSLPLGPGESFCHHLNVSFAYLR